ncbi:FAD-dependent oxidoreductase [Rhizobiales bacterium]|uniref:NAD(P)/FAD-dependent oxidoreductase n=1 Tax=Hongsoonwoonella zoysiae TaxID=2821844 RepID=UPI00155FCA2F|nr:FAD-dependent oxidoreductase [Hongsoonwoonella zoysiae]NRG19056.1 FAD-dependent oxidoreductase [Hongsoonwoonella zoysiae]
MRIAVVGSGIAGNSAAWALSDVHDVVLYEKRNRPGGHSATVEIDYDGETIAVDTGFIVYNELNYPNLSALFGHLGIKSHESDMSFSVSVDGGQREWAGTNLGTIFGQRRNLLSPRFLWMLREILRFNKLAIADRAQGLLYGRSLGDYLAARRFARAFIDDYLIPMGAAIWSTPAKEMLDFPADSFVAFFENHRLVSFDRPKWRTVTGGSRVYVERLLQPLRGKIRLASPVAEIKRVDGRVEVRDESGNLDVFDQVVIAAHTDQTLAMLGDASGQEREMLSAVPYRANTVYLHRDTSLMPKRQRVWSSWNYMRSTAPDAPGSDVSVTYWMNRLQGIDNARPLFVSLNPVKPPHEDLTFGTYTYDHPQFGENALKGQLMLKRLQGKRNTWFCGAWCGYGFHEDGLVSGLDVARGLGAEIPWEVGADGQARIAEAAE